MSDVNNIILKNKIDKISKDVKSLQNNNSQSGSFELDDTYYYENDFYYDQVYTAFIRDMIVANNGSFVNGSSERDNQDGVTGCIRMRVNRNSINTTTQIYRLSKINLLSITSMEITGKISIENTIQNDGGGGRQRIYFGFCNSALSGSGLTFNRIAFRVEASHTGLLCYSDVNIPNDIIYDDVSNSINTATFYKYKVKLDRVGNNIDVNFYINGLLYKNYNVNLTNINIEFMPVLGVITIVPSLNSGLELSTTYCDYIKIKLKYVEGIR